MTCAFLLINKILVKIDFCKIYLAKNIIQIL